jgi:hypothetical protein
MAKCIVLDKQSEMHAEAIRNVPVESVLLGYVLSESKMSVIHAI